MLFVLFNSLCSLIITTPFETTFEPRLVPILQTVVMCIHQKFLFSIEWASIESISSFDRFTNDGLR